MQQAKGDYLALVSHQFGNYVVQKCLKVLDAAKRDEMLRDMKPAVAQLGKTGDEFGVKIYQRLVKKYPVLQAEGVVLPPAKKKNHGQGSQ